MIRAFWAALVAALREHYDAARLGIPVEDLREIRAAETRALRTILLLTAAPDVRWRRRRAVVEEINRRADLARQRQAVQ